MVGCAGKYQVATFEEFIEVALDAERVVGIYPEIKSPVFVNRHVSFWSQAWLLVALAPAPAQGRIFLGLLSFTQFIHF